MTTDQPRTPAGSPDGGQFAEMAGGESVTGLTAVRPRALTDSQAAAIIAGAARSSAICQHLGTVAYRADLAFYSTSLDEMARIAKAVCRDATALHFYRLDSYDNPGGVALHRISCPHVLEDTDDFLDDFAKTHGIEASVLDAIGYNLNDAQIDLGSMLLMTADETGGYTTDLTTYDIPARDRVLGKNTAAQLETRQRELAHIGLKVAALLGSNSEWRGADMLEAIGEIARGHGVEIGSHDIEEISSWRAIAEELGFEHDGDQS